MDELKDYSGEFNPHMRYEEFSKEALVKMLGVFSKLTMLMDGLWNTEVGKKLSVDEVYNIEEAVWLKLARYEREEIIKALNVQGNDVASFMKIQQWLATTFQGVYKYTIELKNNNHGIVTIIDCPQLRYFEKKGDEAGMRKSCHEVEPLVWGRSAKLINPAIETKAIKLPPRKSADEIACQFEFKLEK
ncbi:DUF6125 family protein [Chloroflexota bacterium]